MQTYKKYSSQLSDKIFKPAYYILFLLSLMYFYSAAVAEEKATNNDQAKQQAPTTTCDSIIPTPEEIIEECFDEKAPEVAEDETTQSCGGLVQKAVTCCQTPLQGCMDSSQVESALGAGHESLGMLNQLLPALSPGIANYAAESGIADICQMIAALTGAASSLSAAAKANCSSAMGDCQTGCADEILSKCQKIKDIKYKKWKPKICQEVSDTACKTAQCGTDTLPLDVCIEEFKAEITKEITYIQRRKKQQCECGSQASQLAHMDQNIAQSASSLQSASDCLTGISDGKFARTQAECLMKGNAFQWRGVGKFGQCISLAAECTKHGGTWAPIRNTCQTSRQACSTTGGKWDPQKQGCDYSKSTTNTETNTNTEDCPEGQARKNGVCVPSTSDDATNDSFGGGGSDKDRATIRSPSIALPGTALPGMATASNSPTNPSALKGSAGSGFRIRSLRLPNSPSKEEEEEDSDDYSSSGGGGGFRGYSGGRGGGGSYNSNSKRKLAGRLKNKKGKAIIKRTSNLAGQNKHHSIFERITKRFHQLCAHKINCH